jgi:hypothetical protein
MNVDVRVNNGSPSSNNLPTGNETSKGTPSISRPPTLTTKASFMGSLLARHDSILQTPMSAMADDNMSAILISGIGVTQFPNSTPLDEFTEYDMNTVRQRLTWTYELPDDKLREEYNLFYHDKTSLGLLFFSSMVMSLMVLPCTVLVLVNSILRIETTYGQSSSIEQGKLILSILGVICSVIATSIGLYLDYRHRDQFLQIWYNFWNNPQLDHHHSHSAVSATSCRKEKKNHVVNNLSEEKGSISFDGIQNSMKSERPQSQSHSHSFSKLSSFYSNVSSSSQPQNDYQFTGKLRLLYVIAFQLVFVIASMHRIVFTPDCDKVHFSDEEENRKWILQHLTSTTFIGGELCSDFPVKSSSIVGNTFAIAFILLIFVTNFPGLNIKYVWLCLMIDTIVPVACGIAIGIYDQMVIVPGITLAVAFAISDIQIRNILIFLTAKKLKFVIDEKERLAAETRANELRHMIANVAHDLKTVRNNL